MAPFGGIDGRLSANPIAAGAPGPVDAPIVLDISTSAIAEGKIQVAQNRNELLPEGCTVDSKGRPTRDPRAFYGPPEGALLPFGGHKGYGLAFFCEILAGALTGARIMTVGTGAMRENPVRSRLRDGGSAFGIMAFEFFTSGLATILAEAGAEFVLLDMEHSGAGIDTIKAQIALAHGAGIVPMVRVTSCAYHLIAPVLDAGALGIMAPMIETRAQAEDLVAACRYRPKGRRGLAFGVAHDRYAGGSARVKMDAANEAILTIALIESARGVDNAAEILATPGLDLGWLGHYDLSDSLGCAGDFDDPRYRDAEQRLLATAAAAGKPVGWLVATGEAARAALDRGFRCICIGHEVAVFRNALAREFADARKGSPGPR